MHTSSTSQPKRKETAARVRRFLEREHGEVFPTEQVECSVEEWLERQYEILVEDAFELLTDPRFGYASEFYAGLKRLT